MTSTLSPAIHTVQVGKATDKFDPIAVTADVGDIIVFSFFPANHSVVKAEYGFPCVPYDTVNPGSPSFFSGFFPMESVSPDPPTWNITINDTNPLFYYCSAPGSCLNYGMVGAINANSTQPLEEQKKLAHAADYMLEPGESFPSEASSSALVSALSAATLSVKSSTPLVTSPGSTSTHAQASHGSESMSATKIIAAVGGSLAAILILILTWWLWLIRRRHKSSRVVPVGYNIDTAAVSQPRVHPSTLIGPGSPTSSLSSPMSIVSPGLHSEYFNKSIAELVGDPGQGPPGNPPMSRPIQYR